MALARGRSVLIALAGVVLALAAAVAVNTLRQGSRQLEAAPAQPPAIDANAAAARLAGALRFQTISDYEAPDRNADEFRKLHAYLAATYPKAHATLKREVVGGYSLLYTWEGTDPKAAPAMLMAHQDVVPISPGTEGAWQAPPFEGVVRDGFVWGRGSWDDKGNLFGIMEAVEMLAAQGHRPRRTIYLAFGHDEEVSGQRGAKAIAALLKSRGVRLAFVLDEGLIITEGVMKGLDKPAALIGVAEKGYVTVFLNLTAKPGHASMPPRQTAIGMMSAALARIEDDQFPAGIGGVAQEMFETIAPEMKGINRVLLSNLWLFRPLVRRELEKGASTNAMMRTTTALTIVHAGNKDNVLPGSIEAAVNFRLLPGDTQAGVVEHVRKAVANEDILVTTFAGNAEPSRASPTDAPSYRLLNRTVREVFPGTVVAPGLMIGGTDSRHFEGISDNVYRFSPVRAQPEDLPRFHGTNERISVKNYAELIAFYHRLLVNSSAAQ
ncbi:MAG: M20 family peptidase [Proteobacteria bacterium]|nr:M20 family peptidase [Pseudomonadota bacterium]